MIGRILGLSFVALLFAGCLNDGQYGLFGAACPEMTSSGDPMYAHFSATARADADVRAFVAASKDLSVASLQMEKEAVEACTRMGRDLAVPDAAMEPRSDGPGARAEAACGALGVRIDGILAQGAQVRVSARLPECQADADESARCSGACNVAVDPGEIIAQCQPPQLSGYCYGRCDGGCEGTCRGQCEGQCSSFDTNGYCAGHCDGTCHGGCDATCHVHCEGQWQAPRCQGLVRPPSADAACQASCSARASIRAACTPPSVYVDSSRNTQDVFRLMATLQVNLPELVHAEFALGRSLAASADTVVRVGTDLPNVVGNAGAKALACTAAGANAAASAAVRVRVAFQASASVTGRVGVNG